MSKTYRLKIYRGEPGHQYWEEFEVPFTPTSNVITGLMDIQRRPINTRGERVAPVSWEQGCLEEVCGSCSMLVNGKPRQSCSTVVGPILKKSRSRTITLAPFTKYPLVRDLVVDRAQMFEDLKRISAWVEADGTYIKGSGPKISQKKQEAMYVLSTCMTCGCCTESCPQVSPQSKFIGPAAVSQVRLYNLNPTGAQTAEKRLKPMMEEGGISECGNAQNCVRVCPKEIPLTESIAVMGREVSKQACREVFNMPERSS